MRFNEIEKEVKAAQKEADDFFRDAKEGRSNAGVGNEQHYKALGLKPDASQEDIKQKYRQLMKIVHPDRGGNAYLFVIVKEAYETLHEQAKAAV
ncbi:J domain-containing protein [Alteribacillus sp. JSM 102045]|uniref:J domain-containing protein n=1 Tax=Alteribacillus sp. JSM 102045 TaxID=1562101 RepID=UPI0035BF8CD2